MNVVEKIKKFINSDINRLILIIISFLGFTIRLFLSLRAFGIYHPDEIFQSLEMAHLIVYDSGKIPPEFMTENQNIPSYAAARSWLFPMIFASIMYFGEVINLNYHYQILPLIRILLAINSTLLIPVVFKFIKYLTNDENYGLIGASLIAFHWRLIELSIRPFTNTFFLAMLIYGLYRILIVLEKNELGIRDTVILTLFVGVVTYVRIDLGIGVFSLFIVMFDKLKIRMYFKIFLRGVCGWLIGVIIDFAFYGRLLSVPINWITFNLNYSHLFGVSDRYYYFEEMVLGDGLLLYGILSTVIFLIMIINGYFKLNYFENFDYNGSRSGFKASYIRIYCLNILSWAISSNIWTDASHKEIRFNTLNLVFLLILFSFAIWEGIKLLSDLVFMVDLSSISRYNYKLSLTKVRRVITILFILLFVFQSFYYHSHRGYVENFDDVNKALIFVGQQDDVDSVIILGHWYLSGSYTYLHKSMSTEISYINLVDPKTSFDTMENLEQILKDLDGNDYLIVPVYQLEVDKDNLNNIFIENQIEIIENVEDRTYVYKKII
tara:strand:+ start:4266 stop:5912 length:1647 start_codon:yes stop_codon:yes gene_type:complete